MCFLITCILCLKFFAGEVVLKRKFFSFPESWEKEDVLVKSLANETAIRRKYFDLFFYNMDNASVWQIENTNPVWKKKTKDDPPQYYVKAKSVDTTGSNTFKLLESDLHMMIRCYYTKNPDQDLAIIGYEEFTGGSEDPQHQKVLIKEWIDNGMTFHHKPAPKQRPPARSRSKSSSARGKQKGRSSNFGKSKSSKSPPKKKKRHEVIETTSSSESEDSVAPKSPSKRKTKPRRVGERQSPRLNKKKAPEKEPEKRKRQEEEDDGDSGSVTEGDDDV